MKAGKGKFLFGKYKGQDYLHVQRMDPQYFRWACENIDGFREKTCGAPGGRRKKFVAVTPEEALRRLEAARAAWEKPKLEDQPNQEYFLEYFKEPISPETHKIEPLDLDPETAPW
jgi:hypothetical protein